MKRNIRTLITLSVATAVGVTATGCAFTQWTDRYYFGTADGPPVYENRTMTGIVILPFAIVGDIISAPVQVLLLAVMGDQWLYSKRTRGTFVSANDEKLRALGPEQREQLVAKLEQAMARAEAEGRKNVAFGIDAQGNVVEVKVTADQAREVTARADRFQQGAAGGYAVFSAGKVAPVAR